MTTVLQEIALLLGLQIVVFWYVSLRLIKLGKELNIHMATAAQALKDLQQGVGDLTTAVQATTAELTTLLDDIIAANGVQPAQVEASVAQIRQLVTNLNTAVASAQATTNPPAPVVVAINPSSATLAPNGTTQFVASVSGGATGGDQSVKWTAQSGQVDANGNYTAPASNGTDVVTATSNQDSTKNATASVTITS